MGARRLFPALALAGLCLAHARQDRMFESLPSRGSMRGRGEKGWLEGPVAPGPSTAPLAEKHNWTLIWEDNFDGHSLDERKWNKRFGTHCCDREIEMYVPENVGVSGGQVHLTTKNELTLGPQGLLADFSSGWIDTLGKFSMKYGKVEARVKLCGGFGSWSAFWMLPSNTSICWPTGGEVDIYEQIPLKVAPDAEPWGSYRWGPKCYDNLFPLPGRPMPGKDFDTEWHTAGLEWTDHSLEFLFDGKVYYTITDKLILPHNSMYVIFDTAVNPWIQPPTGSTNYPCQHSVDWIRAYEWKK